MARKELDAILEAEKAAAEAVDSAKARAKELVAASEKEAERLVAEALESARAEAVALSTRSREAVQDLDKATFEQARKEIARVREIAGAKFDEAVGIVVSRVKKAV